MIGRGMKESRRPAIRKAAAFCIILAVLGALATILAGPGYRLGLWDYPFGFSVLRWAAYVGASLVAMSLCVGLFAFTHRGWRSVGLSVLALVIGFATAAVPWSYLQKIREAPPIHDITTDTENPPRFIDILPLRAGSENSVDYGGSLIAAQQLKAYPDLGPVTYRLPPNQVFDRTLGVVRDLGWNIVAIENDQGRIEATDTSFWFGFVDDIVIRVRYDPKGSKVDIRSAARSGVGDLGVNAERIQAFIDRLIDGSIVR